MAICELSMKECPENEDCEYWVKEKCVHNHHIENGCVGE